MKENQQLRDAFDYLVVMDLDGATTAMENHLASHPQHNTIDSLQAIKADYDRMTDYWKRGYKDPKQEELYRDLLVRVYRLYYDTAVVDDLCSSPILKTYYNRVQQSARDWSAQNIREMLETFVSEVAMLELEPPHVSGKKRKALYAQHKQQMSELFDYLWTMGCWTDGFAAAMEQMLLSPTVDVIDQQLMVSGVTLSLTEHFDIAKFRTLVHVYQQAEQEPVRQRALVGWALSLNADIGKALFPEETALVQKLVEDEHCRQDLIKLQKQLIYCLKAESDTQTIQEEIMPDLLKGNNFKVTRDGFVEEEEDPMEDILHSDETERSLERMEQSFNRMLDMQKQGSDIYFGGFSQMKRFSFFNDISNWFVPYYPEHPDIREAMEILENSHFATHVMQMLPFCDSDKYSFVLAFSNVYQKLPENIREMFEHSEPFEAINSLGHQDIPDYIRRGYLQVIYRFYKVFPYRSEFRKIMTEEHDDVGYLFFANEIFRSTHLEACFNEITAFLIKQQRPFDAGDMMENYGEYRRDFEYYLMAGYLAREQELSNDTEDLTSLYCYEKALGMRPDSVQALKGYARALFAVHRFEDALHQYDRLLELQPGKRGYELNRAVCLTKLKRYAEATQLLYRLNYEDENDKTVNRVLAWTLTCDGKYEQAQKFYQTLLSDNPTDEDLLNYGCCLWMKGDISDAADCLHRYMKMIDAEPDFLIYHNIEKLDEWGISTAERQMMRHLL